MVKFKHDQLCFCMKFIYMLLKQHASKFMVIAMKILKIRLKVLFSKVTKRKHFTWAKWNLCPGNCFSFKVIETLTFDLVTPNSIGVFYPIWTIML